jgi:tetratricopeptide (TPR) repeat protein
MQVRALVLVVPILVTGTLLLAQAPIDTTLHPGMAGSPGSGFNVVDNYGSINGSILTIDGRPITDTQVELHDTNGTVLAVAYSKANGSFEFTNLPTGQFDVVASRGVDQCHERIRVEHGPAQVTLRMTSPKSEPGSGNTVSVATLRIPDKAEDEFRKASDAFQKNKLDEAEKHNEKALASVPNYAQALTMRGLLKINRGDIAGGTEALHAAIHNDPNYPLAYFAMGATLNGEGQYTEAQKAIEQGLKIEPTSWQGYFELSKAVMGQHDFRNALKYVVKAEGLGGGVYAPMHLVKAHALLGLKDYDEAATELEQYLAKDSTGPRAEEARRTLDQAKAFSATASN